GRDQVALPAADCLVEQWGNLGQVPVVRIARQQLVVPPQRARALVEGDEGIGIEVRPRPEPTRQVGGGVRDRRVQFPLGRIERERRPHRPASLGNAGRVWRQRGRQLAASIATVARTVVRYITPRYTNGPVWKVSLEPAWKTQATASRATLAGVSCASFE